MSTSACVAVFGTASLQRYIFQSNRLKENIGASYLAKHWLDEGLTGAMQAACETWEVDRTTWNSYEQKPDREMPGATGKATDIEVIYVGGGNAALLCKDRDVARKAVSAWSRELLEKAPGLQVAVGYGDVNDSLAAAYRDALNDLAHCEEALPFGAALYGLPVVRTCTSTGLPASVRNGVSGYLRPQRANKSKLAPNKIRVTPRTPSRKNFSRFCKRNSALPSNLTSWAVVKGSRILPLCMPTETGWANGSTR